MAMPIPSLMMVAAALVALGFLCWFGASGWLSLSAAADREASRDAAQRPTEGPMLLLAAVAVMFVSSIGSSIGMSLITDASAAALGEQALVQWLGTLAGVALAAVLAWRWEAARGAIGWMGLDGQRVMGYLRWGVVGSLVLLPVVWGVGTLSALVWRWVRGSPTDPIAHDTLRAMMEASVDGGWWLMVGAVVIAAPVFEEVLYRGFVQGGVWRILQTMAGRGGLGGPLTAEGWAGGTGGTGGAWGAVAITAVCFTLMHGGVAAWVAMPSLLVLAVGLGWLRMRTGSVVVPMFVHGAFNAMNLVLAKMMMP